MAVNFMSRPQQLSFIILLVINFLGPASMAQVGDGCVRGEPQSEVIKSRVQNWSFHLDPVSRIGYEKATIQGNQLQIENKGCEYYWVSFKYKTGDVVNLEQKHKELASYLRLTCEITKFFFNFDQVIDTLFLDNSLNLENPIYLNEYGSEYFELQKITQDSVCFDFVIGPL